MYGTIARLRVKKGKLDELTRLAGGEARKIPGIVFNYVYQTDADPQNLYLVVGFESRDAYRRNAESPEQHELYLAYRALLEEEPEWHDGEIIFNF